MNRKFSSYILNKNAVKRIFLLYLPVLTVLWLGLCVAGLFLDKEPAALILTQSFNNKVPVLYDDRYNIKFAGLEEYHPFDSVKYGRIFQGIGLSVDQIPQGGVPDKEILRLAHTQEYLESLENAWVLARVTELGFLRFFPSMLTKQVILKPMQYQVGGSLLAAIAALDHGWAINLGGGFHHASFDNGEGFCALADVGLIVKYLRRENKLKRVMIVDLDAHQGNGHERDFLEDDDVYIVDVYNREIFPHDEYAKKGIDLAVELPAFISDVEYLSHVDRALKAAIKDFTPDLIIYIAGTDILDGDPLGALRVSAQGIVDRDEMVFKYAFDHRIPVVMLLGGGYQKSNADIIRGSILNLKKKFNLW